VISLREFPAPEHRTWSISFLAINIIVYSVSTCLVLGGATFFLSWLKIHWQLLLAIYVGLVATLVIGNLAGWKFKALLVFWDISRPLPVNRVLERYRPRKRDTTCDDLDSHNARLPLEPAEQEALWLRIHSTHQADPAVAEVRGEFLIAQEIAWLSLVVLIFFSMAWLLTVDFRLETLAYPSLLLIQYIAAAAVARSFGIRFLGNVLAVAQTHKIVS